MKSELCQLPKPIWFTRMLSYWKESPLADPIKYWQIFLEKKQQDKQNNNNNNNFALKNTWKKLLLADDNAVQVTADDIFSVSEKAFEIFQANNSTSALDRYARPCGRHFRRKIKKDKKPDWEEKRKERNNKNNPKKRKEKVKIKCVGVDSRFWQPWWISLQVVVG